MEKIKGFEIVEQFLNDWLKQSKEWYSKKYKEYLTEKEYNKEHPSYATQLYRNQYNRADEIHKGIVLLFRFEAGHGQKIRSGCIDMDINDFTRNNADPFDDRIFHFVSVFCRRFCEMIFIKLEHGFRGEGSLSSFV